MGRMGGTWLQTSEIGAEGGCRLLRKALGASRVKQRSAEALAAAKVSTLLYIVQTSKHVEICLVISYPGDICAKGCVATITIPSQNPSHGTLSLDMSRSGGSVWRT